MKTQIKRFSKSTLAVILSVCMLISCMTVGIIATDAAKVSDSGAIAASTDSESLGASSSITVYFQDNYNWGTVYAFSGSNMNVRDSSGYGYDVYGGSLNTGWITMTKVTGTSNIFKATLTVYDGKVAFAKAKSNQAGYFNNCQQCAVTPSGMTNGKLLNIWTGNNDEVKNQNGTSYRKYNLLDYTPPVPYITGINSDWDNGDVMTLDSGNDYYYQFSGDGNDKYFRFKVSSTYYEAYNDGFNLETDGEYKPYDGSTSNKKYGAKSGNSYAFKLIASTGYTYRVYFDLSSNKVWFTKTQVSTTYTGITAVAKGTTDGSSYSEDLGSIQSSTSVNSSTGLSVTAPDETGYTFSKWVASGSGTFDDANSASTTFHPAANDEIATAQYKKNYTISKNSPSNGTITLSKTSAVAGESYTVTVTPNQGYKVSDFTVGGVDKKSNINSGVYSGTASGSSDTIACNVTFALNDTLNLAIAGRFHVRTAEGSSSWMNTWGSGSGDWSDTGFNGNTAYIPFIWDSTAGKYKVQTYASLAELTNNLSNNPPYLYVYDKTNSKYYYSSTSKTFDTTTAEVTLTAYSNKSSTYDTYLKFNSSSTDSPVTLYFDATTGVLSYTIPNYYDVTVNNPAQGGTVTAAPTHTTNGTEITLTISPTDGWELSNISTSPTVTLSGTGNTRTFNMPESNVTVTPTFAKKKFSGLTAVGKYSAAGGDTGSNYNTDLPSNPASITNTTNVTQVDGTTVSVPGTDPEGYVFAGWYTSTGRFENDANKDTIFYPNAANAVAVAKYKPIYTITASVDGTGTGAGDAPTINITSGAVSGQANKILAGGSYEITASAKSNSSIESVTVNSSNKGTSGTTTISTVDGDQTVVVKYKSDVYLRGTNTMITGGFDPGDVMQANSDGTKYTASYNAVVGSSGGTTYEFKLYKNGNYNEDSSATFSITGGSTTGTGEHESAYPYNYKLVLKKEANVTIESDGTKITKITVIPTTISQKAITFKKVANTTISGTYQGVDFSTASADAVVNVYESDDIEFTVTAASGMYISSLTSTAGTPSPAFAATASYTGTISNVTAASTITPAAAAKLAVTAKTNKTARGTVSVDKETAIPGETVTITCSPANGVLSTLVVSSGNTVIKSWSYDRSTGKYTVTTEQTAQASANKVSVKNVASVYGAAYNLFKKEFDEAIGAAGDKVTTPTFNMVSSAVTVTATYDAYSGDSDYYYNGYDTSGNKLSDYDSKQMTEVMLNGVPYSYYKVSGRTETDQLLTVSKKASDSSTHYAYFTRPSNWGVWKNDKAPYAYFFNDSGAVGTTYPGTMMTHISGHDFKIAIPEGATKVIFSDSESGGTGTQTVDITMTSTTSAYYLDGGYDDSSGTRKYTVSPWNPQPSYAGTGNSEEEYFCNASNRYYGYVNGFNSSSNSWADYNAGSHTTDGDRFAKPNENMSSKGDYYVMVFYAGNTYTSGNGTLNLTGNDNHDVVMWTYELPSSIDDESVTVYAKDGSIRTESSGSTYANIADTKIYSDDGITTVGTKKNGNISNQTYETYSASKGDTIVIKTQIGATDDGTLSNASDFKAKYYVRGFCVNGEVSELLSWNSDGLYTLTYTVPEDYEGTKIEITPIYYLKDTTANPVVTYRVTGFTDALKEVGSGKPGWGDTLFTYPFYGSYGGQNNAFGAYPGQPMVYYKGQYQMQIPQNDTAWDPYEESAAAIAATHVSGVTMSNGYYDLVHRQIMGYGDNSSSSDHVQTYDYGDFYKIFNEKENVDNIVFDFKYETTTHNFETEAPASPTPATLSSKYQNGFELLTNFHGRTVDLFGTPLSGDAADTSKTKPLYVVSVGGVNGTAGVENVAGYYATEWKVFAPDTIAGTPSTSDSYSLQSNGKSSIPPEVLVLNNTSSFNATTYPSADSDYTITDWQALYTTLEAYRGIPVMITYEAADAQIGSKIYNTSGGGGATRNDGRWLYSKNGESITSTIKIQYSNDSGSTYTDLDTTSPQVSGLYAYFTNAEVDEGAMTYSTTIDPDKTFDFEAKTTNGSYKFVGWYFDNGVKISDDNISHTERSGSYTFVAKFMQVSSGQLTLSHTVDTDTTYKGSGTASIAVTVYNSENEVFRTYSAANTITLDDKVIKSDQKDYRIEVTLNSAPSGEDSFAKITCASNYNSFSNKYLGNNSTEYTGARPYTFNFTVGDLYENASSSEQKTLSILYHSYFNKTEFKYKLTFNFPSRDKDGSGNAVNKSYVREGTLTAAQLADKNYYVKNGSTRTLKAAFINRLAPHESNFNQELAWTIADINFPSTMTDNAYTITQSFTAEDVTDSSVTRSTKRTVTFNLPYEYTDGVPSNLNIMDEATTDNLVVSNIPYGTIVKVNGNYVTAPRQLSNGNVIKNFQYWEVKTTTGTTVAKCYYYSFNFLVYDNYVITPVYDTGDTPFGGSETTASITYLESSRNQFNGEGETTTGTAAEQRAVAADLIYNDFVLGYNYNDVNIYKNDDTSSAVTELGMVVERVQQLEVQQDGTPYTDPNHYSDVSVKTDEEIRTFISSNKKSEGTLSKSIINKTKLDNKNRIEFYKAYYNSAAWDKDTQKPGTKYAYKNYVYKAYSYMIVSGTVVLSVPVYFTMYDEATK